MEKFRYQVLKMHHSNFSGILSKNIKLQNIPLVKDIFTMIEL